MYNDDLEFSFVKDGKICYTANNPMYDNRAEDLENNEVPAHPIAWLDHSCNQWVIGGPEQVKDMIHQLQYVLELWEKG